MELPPAVVEQLTAAVRKSSPNAAIRITNNMFMAMSDTMTFEIHRSSKTGRFLQETQRTEGPNAHGFIFKVSLRPGKYKGPMDVPQTMRGPYWSTFFDRRTSHEKDCHLAIELAYGPRLPRQTRDDILGALPESEHGFLNIGSHPPGVRALARKFVSALAARDPKAARACWLPADVLLDFVNARPADDPLREQITEEGARQMLDDRHEEVDPRLDNAIIGLFEHYGDIRSLALLSLEGDIEMEEGLGVRKVETLQVRMRLENGAEIEYDLGDALELGAQWYLVGLPGSGLRLYENNRSAGSIRVEPK